MTGVTRPEELDDICNSRGLKPLPTSIFQMPSMFVTFNARGDVNINSIRFIDEIEHTPFPRRLLRSRFIEALSQYVSIVMFVTMCNSQYDTVHYNAFIWINGRLELFEPRGDIRSDLQTTVIRNFYNPRSFLSFGMNLFQSFLPLSYLIKNTTKVISKITDAPLPNGILTYNSSFIRSTFSQELVFSYVAIRCNTFYQAQHRKNAHEAWLLYESTRQ